MSESCGCICCGSTFASQYLPGLLQCRSCTHVWADLRLSADQLHSLYGRNYFHGGEYANYSEEKKALIKNFQRRMNSLKKQIPAQSQLWEIGCAYGYFLEMASSYFSVAGCDISEHAVDHARSILGLDVTATDYLTLPPPNKPHDVICLWDTIEHLQEPHLYIEKAFGELVENGMLALSTGDIGSVVARFRGAKWRLTT